MIAMIGIFHQNLKAMPRLIRTVQLFGCAFKCGHKADLKHKIETHEKHCFCNPENKACRICANCLFDEDALICKAKKLIYATKNNKEKVVRDLDTDEIIFEPMLDKPLSLDDFWFRYTEKQMKHNKSRPFPAINCELFILGKKVY